MGRFAVQGKGLWTGIELISGFHYSTIAQEMVSGRVGLGLQQLLRGDLPGLKKNLTTPASSIGIGSLAQDYLKDPEGFLKNPKVQEKLDKWFGKDRPTMEHFVDAYFKGGGLTHQDPTLRWGTKKMTGLDWIREGSKEHKAGHVIFGGMKVPFDVARYVTRELLFEKIIPNAKFSNFALQYAYNLKQYAGQIKRGLITEDEIARRTVASQENKFGEMNWDNFWMNKTWKSALQLLFRSYTWQAGTWRGFGTAAKRVPEQIRFIHDAIKNGEKPPIDQDMAWVVGLVATHIAEATLLGYGAAAITGNEDLKPQSWFDYIFPKIGLATRIAIPGYVKEPISLYQSMKKDPWHIPASYVESKMSGFVGKILELRKNKDYYGNKIYDEDSSVVSKAKDIGGHMMVKPFSLTSYLSEKKDGGGAGEAALGAFGFQKAPWWVGKTEMETRLMGMHRHMEEGRGKEEAAKLQIKRQIEKKIRADDPSAENDMEAAIEDGRLTPKDRHEIKARAKQDPIELYTKSLGLKDIVKLSEVATDEEKEILRRIFRQKIDNKKDLAPDQRKKYIQLWEDM